MRSLLGALLAAQLVAAPAFAQETVVEPIEASPPPPPPAPSPAYRLPESDDVKVHIDANFPDAGLEPAEPGAQRCLAPCDKSFPRDGAYRITGDGLIPSDRFQLPARPNQVTLDVQASMKAQETTGEVMGIGGLVVMGLTVLYALEVVAANIDGPPATPTQRGIMVGGVVGGLAVSAFGALLYITAGTHVRSKGAPLRYGSPSP